MMTVSKGARTIAVQPSHPAEIEARAHEIAQQGTDEQECKELECLDGIRQDGGCKRALRHGLGDGKRFLAQGR